MAVLSPVHRLVLVLALLGAISAAHAWRVVLPEQSEAEWTSEWCALHDMIYDAPGDGRRPSALVFGTVSGRHVVADCIGENAVVEVDFARKYHEGIGQALEYGRLARLDPILLLIVESASDCKYLLDAQALVWETNQRVQVVSTGHNCQR